MDCYGVRIIRNYAVNRVEVFTDCSTVVVKHMKLVVHNNNNNTSLAKETYFALSQPFHARS